MRRFLLAACVLAPLPAVAMEEPGPGPLDSRVLVETYAPLQVVRVCSTDLAPVSIVLDDGEHAGVLAGLLVSKEKDEAKDWFATIAGNMLILQPLHSDIPPSVLTFSGFTADQRQRPYYIELCVRKGKLAGDDPDPTAYMAVQFRYPPVVLPGDPNAAAGLAARREAARQAAEDRAVRSRFERAAATSGAPLNTAYEKQGVGCVVLTPDYPPGPRKFVTDDGLRTKLDWPAHATLPAVYVLNQDGKKSVLTTFNADTTTGTEVMLPGVYRFVYLKRGGQVCRLRNNAPDSIGQKPGGGTGTISPDVTLQAKQ